MPYFIHHYFDFKGRCPNKPYWAFIIPSQLLCTLLCVPYLFHYLDTLLVNDAFIQLIEQVDVLMLQDQTTLQSLLLQACTASWGESLATFPQAGLITQVCSYAFLLVAVGIIIPSLALTTCRLRDSGSSQLWWLLMLPTLIGNGVIFFSGDWALLTSPSMSALSALGTVVTILFLVILCKASKSEV